MKYVKFVKFVAAVTAVAAFHANAAEIEDFGRVVSVTERVERVNYPREECTNETVSGGAQATGGQRDVSGAVIGGIAGAILGSQVGKGNGKTAGAAVGAATGAIVGDRVQNGAGATQTVKSCRMVDSWQTKSSGYDVAYEYRGRTFTDTLPFRPGDQIRLRVSVTPQR